jgi:hypothetical protein
MNKKRREELLAEIKEQIENSCKDVQIVHISGPKGGRTVEVVRRYRCHKTKGHAGDHKDNIQYVGWSQGTESPTKIVVGRKEKGGSYAELLRR